MKKLLSIPLLLSTLLYAEPVPIVEGWNLLGTSQELDPQTMQCVNMIWVYNVDEGWQLFTNTTLMQPPSHYGYKAFNRIKRGSGFWVNANCNTSLTLTEANVTATQSTSTVDLNQSSLTFTYAIVDTNQNRCFDSISGVETTCSAKGYDADYLGYAPSYTLSASSNIVTDNVTGLMWTQSSDVDGDGVTTDVDDKLTYAEAINYCKDLTLDGYDDWRLPDIKTLYSLIDFSGKDPSAEMQINLDTNDTFLPDIFAKAFGDSSTERYIDAQYATTTKYVSTTMNGNETMFGVNFIDGRIKGYPISIINNEEKKFYTLCTRGNEEYGKNNFVDNNDSTITDTATGLMWEQNDTKSSDFENAVAICESSTTAGYSDWRLPNAKELQSIIDYTRAPDTNASAAIDPLFNTSSIVNEAGQTDYGYYWSSTTHLDSRGNGSSGVYIPFGRALGYFMNDVIDVHGAGAQRTNSKQIENEQGAILQSNLNGEFYYKGPQGDIIRIDNMVRCVR